MAISKAGYAWYTPYSPQGMELAYVTTTTLTVAAGKTPNSTFENIITLDAPITISLAALGAGGIDAGTVAASTKYFVYVIGSSNNYGEEEGFLRTGDNDYLGSAILSTSETPSLPFGYDMYRYVGAIYTTAGSVIEPFVQYGSGQERTMMYVTALSELAGGTSATYANIDVASAVPKVGLRAILKLAVTPTAANNAAHVLPFGVTSTNGFVTVSGDVAAVVQTTTGCICAVGSNAGVPTLQYKVTGAVTISVQGYIDQL